MTKCSLLIIIVKLNVHALKQTLAYTYIHIYIWFKLHVYLDHHKKTNSNSKHKINYWNSLLVIYSVLTKCALKSNTVRWFIRDYYEGYNIREFFITPLCLQLAQTALCIITHQILSAKLHWHAVMHNMLSTMLAGREGLPVSLSKWDFYWFFWLCHHTEPWATRLKIWKVKYSRAHGVFGIFQLTTYFGFLSGWNNL